MQELSAVPAETTFLTLNKDLLASNKTVSGHAIFSNTKNWAKVALRFANNSDTQHYTVVFDITSEEPKSLIKKETWLKCRNFQLVRIDILGKAGDLFPIDLSLKALISLAGTPINYAMTEAGE